MPAEPRERRTTGDPGPFIGFRSGIAPMTTAGVRRSLAVVWLGTIASLSPPAQAAVETLTVTTPRQFGYVIGDRIEHRVLLVLRPGFELDPASIPEPGRTGRWLALNEAGLEGKARGGASRHTIRLRYQVVNAAQSVIGAGTPPVSLRILGPEGDLPVVVPAWGFTIGPIVAPEERPPGSLPDLRPALPPPPIPTTARTARIAALGLLAAALLVLAARPYLRGWLGRSAPGPFDHACRRVERRIRNRQAPAVYADTLVEIHSAFNATAGRAVFEHDLARFFVEHPRFEPLRAPIRRSSRNRGGCFTGKVKPRCPMRRTSTACAHCAARAATWSGAGERTGRSARLGARIASAGGAAPAPAAVGGDPLLLARAGPGGPGVTLAGPGVARGRGAHHRVAGTRRQRPAPARVRGRADRARSPHGAAGRSQRQHGPALRHDGDRRSGGTGRAPVQGRSGTPAPLRVRRRAARRSVRGGGVQHVPDTGAGAHRSPRGGDRVDRGRQRGARARRDRHRFRAGSRRSNTSRTSHTRAPGSWCWSPTAPGRSA